MHNPIILWSFLKQDETNFPVFGPCMLTWCSCQAAAVGWERGPLRPAGGAEGSAPGRSTAAAPEDCRQRQRSRLGASGSGRWGTKRESSIIWCCEMWTNLHNWQTACTVQETTCKNTSTYIVHGYEALVATAIATSYSFLLLRHVGPLGVYWLPNAIMYIHRLETLDKST